jgi:hypothetical protein
MGHTDPLAGAEALEMVARRARQGAPLAGPPSMAPLLIEDGGAGRADARGTPPLARTAVSRRARRGEG